MQYDFLKKLSLALDEFKKRMQEETYKLERREKEIDDTLVKSHDLVEKSNDIETVLANKEFFLNLDISLVDFFDLLEFLKERDNLDNEGAKEAYIKIVNSPEVSKLITYPSELDSELEELREKKNKISRALNGDFDSLVELLHHYKYSSEEKTNILLCLIADKNKLLKDEEVEVIEEEPTGVVSESETSSKFMTKLPEWVEEYNSAYEEYMYLQKESDELIAKYFGKKYSKNKKDYEDYAEKNDADKVEYLGLSPEETAFVLAIKLFDARKSVSAYLAKLNEDGGKNKFNYEYTKLLIDEYKLVFDELTKVNQKIDESEIEEMDESKAFFAHNDKDELLIPDLKKCAKKLEIFIKKSENGAVERKEAKVNRILGLKKEEKILNEKIFMLNSLISISYIKINLPDSTGIYILASGHYDEIKDITADLIHEYGEKIKEQIAMLESQDVEELGRQSSIRKQVNDLIEEESHVL